MIGLKIKMNTLYPIFVKANNLTILIVGNGDIACEKITNLLQHSPDAKLCILADNPSETLFALINQHSLYHIHSNINTTIINFNDYALLIGASENSTENKKLHDLAKQYNILINVADTPELCDFYLGAVVSKGDVKIAISTNGKSPSLAIRLKQLLNELLPNELDNIANNMQKIRKQLSGDFQQKAQQLAKITSSLVG